MVLWQLLFLIQNLEKLRIKYQIMLNILLLLNLINWHCLNFGPGSRRWTWEKMDPLKNRSKGLKLLPSFSSHMKDNVEVIHFHIKSRGVHGLVFIKITCEKCTTNLSVENCEKGFWTFYETSNVFLSRVLDLLSQNF